ncbi:MAG: hypothetical protein IKO02_04090, partial [Lentisphaeria bacterium]|nr:hypothetical protein [Lentisphaeria bacterium]
MSQLKNYYFELFHRDVEPIVTASSRWGVQSEYVIGTDHFGYTNWVSDEGDLQSTVPSGEDAAMYINAAGNVALDVDIVAHTVELGGAATLNVTGNRSLLILDHFALNGIVSVNNNCGLTNAAVSALQLTGAGKLNLSGDGTLGYLGTAENRNAFTIGKDLTVTTLGYSGGIIYANLTNAGTITTEAGKLTLSGNTVENAGSIVTGGKSITLENATVNDTGTLNGTAGEILLNGTIVSDNTLTGDLRTCGNTSTLNRVTVDGNGVLDIQAQAVAQGTLTIDGKVTVQNNKGLYNESGESAVALNGAGKLNLSGDGTSGSLGTEECRGAFTIGKDLTVTTLGYSGGSIFADLTNNGTVSTESGSQTLSGNTIENAGTIVTGGNKSITLLGSTVRGGGTLYGKTGIVYLNRSSLDGSTLRGQVQATDKKSTLKDVTVDIDGKFSVSGDVALQSSLTINGTASVQNNCRLVNESADTPVKLSGIGTLNLGGNGTQGTLGGNDDAGGFELGGELTLTTIGYSGGNIRADIKNNGLITTSMGNLNIAGCTIENHGAILTGGKAISVSGATITGDGELNGANGTIYLANTVLDHAVVKGFVQSQTGTELNGISVTADGRIDVTGLSTTNGLRIDGALSVFNNSVLAASGEDEALLTGTGTIGLGGDGTSGSLGNAKDKFSLGEGLTLTTPGYSSGTINADVTNRGEITTGAGELRIAGAKDAPLAFRNHGTVRSGAKSITFTNAAVDNAGGSLVGGDNAVYLGSGTALTGGTLGGRLQVYSGASVVLDEGDCIQEGKVTISGDGVFTAGNLLAQADFDVENNGSLSLSNVALAGKVNVFNAPKEVSITGVHGVFELVLSSSYASRYTILGNDFSNASVTINGGGAVDLSGNYWGGLTDEAEIRAKFGLGDNINVGNALTEIPGNNVLFLTGAELANGKYLSLAQANLKLTFLLSLDPETITEQTVQLWDDTANCQVPLADRLPAVQDNSLVFDNALFEDGHSYRVVFTDGVRSSNGCILNTDFKDSVAFAVDRTAPKVLDIEKTVNLTGKLPDFRITFSSEIDASTLPGALKVTSPDGQNIGVQISMLNDQVALVTSGTAINVPGEYTVSVDAGKLADKAGNRLQESFEGTIEMTRINLDIKELTVSKDSVAQGEAFNVQWKTFNLEDADLYG